ncbi:unnamed protein product [Calicophoron daubneyi]|uniref:Major facilitator superfamily (MFS) profile domain-containing protein n=1 Tax=Calicophoron daubneyi TaxID=300641 RepID=A0AAV2TJC6_CALDB
MFCKPVPWLILAVSALSVIFLGGKRRAFGIFVAQLHAEFNQTSLAELNWIGDSYSAVGYLTTTLSTSAILATGRRFWASQLLGAIFVFLACLTSSYVPNPHWLFMTHTVLHGIGSSLVLSSAGLVVNEYFDNNHRYHILATTLVSGGSVASIVFVQFYAYLIETYGWRQSFIILGILYFFVLILGTFVFHKNAAKADYRNENCVLLDRERLTCTRSSLLILWLFDRIITSIITYGMLLNLADYMHRREPSLTKSALLTTLFAAGEASTYLIGATLTGITQNFFKNRLKYILLVTSFIMSVGLIIWEFGAENQHLSQFLAFACGFCLGPSITFLFPAGEEMTMLPGHMAYPFSLGGMGIGMSLSPILSAVIAQAFKYRWFFLVQGALMAGKFFCLLASTILLNLLAPNRSYTVTALDESTEEHCRDRSYSDSSLTSQRGRRWPTSLRRTTISASEDEEYLIEHPNPVKKEETRKNSH